MSVIIRSDKPCIVCLSHHAVQTPYSEAEYEKRLLRIDTGALIQDAFPELSAEQREILITGICQKGWDKTFSERE